MLADILKCKSSVTASNEGLLKMSTKRASVGTKRFETATTTSYHDDGELLLT